MHQISMVMKITYFMKDWVFYQSGIVWNNLFAFNIYNSLNVWLQNYFKPEAKGRGETVG